jgi:hypothetical protein
LIPKARRGRGIAALLHADSYISSRVRKEKVLYFGDEKFGEVKGIATPALGQGWHLLLTFRIVVLNQLGNNSSDIGQGHK